MSHRTGFVFDTNALISGLLFKSSKLGQAFQYALKSGDILLSLQTLAELSDVLSRKKFDRYVTSVEREEFLEALIERAILVEPIETVTVCRDPKDDKFLELALNAKASFIITGDENLLELNPFSGVRILKPDKFLQVFEEDDL
ncbi:putative toxin-antitoxin system toxin component, PIN family [Plectonema radiosum NIES-515]|uniref:Toxin-antitoxin system toxin component, PIN family n=1 Tax=Plectonema radiosum NIES-515 TaxID=2986073 RepID=A0ABT3B0U7_9CYAN|nr:putative toxin-antitoxin system toxin component, PIN family [Plectonema radiosum]MCV3214494.1 putative toxin-antitoxin system toxin component, PIN family [Plectonema radiosum NIES-515]